jgi:HEAT repeat protein
VGDFLRKLTLVAFGYCPAPARRFILRRLVRRSRSLGDALIPVAIRDRDVNVRLAALGVVASRRQRQDLGVVGRYLQHALRDPHPQVRAAAAWALGHVPTLHFSSLLEDALADGDGEVRASAAWALGRVGRAEAAVLLRAMSARDPVYQNRRVAEQSMQQVERRTAPTEKKRRWARVELVDVLLDDRCSSEKRQQARACLIRIGGDSSLIQILDRALHKTNDVGVHLHIVQTLATLAPCKQLQNVLIGCLHHPSPPVRHTAIVALGDVADKEAIYYLDIVVREGEQSMRTLRPVDAQLALEAIQKIKARASETPLGPR